MTHRVVTSQLGARMHYAVPRILHGAGMLEHLYTDLCASQRLSRAMAVLPARYHPAPLRRLLGRRPAPIPDSMITTFPAMAIEYAMRLRGRAPVEEAYLWAADRFSRAVNRHGFGSGTMLYAFSGAALGQLRAARARGLGTVVEQVVAPHHLLYRILDEEARRHPRWAGVSRITPVQARFADVEMEEWDQADLVVCGSSFVVDGIRACGGPVDRAVVVPYGVDHRFHLPPRRPHGGPLRVLVVGEVGLRKGSPYVVEAARRLGGAAQVRMIGPCRLAPSVRADIGRWVDLTGPVPRSGIHEHFAWADVFLLPSLCEGSATVTYEALAASLPVICTHSTGSVVRHGREGLIVPPRDSDAIAEAVTHLSENRDVYERMAAQAEQRAAHGSLEAYQARLLDALATPSMRRAAS